MLYGVILYVWVKKKIDPRSGPLLDPILLYFRGILAHTSGFAKGVILIVYVLVYQFLRSFRHCPGGIFSLFQNIQFWALGGVLKIGGLKPLNMHFFNRGMLFRHVIYHAYHPTLNGHQNSTVQN